MLESAVQAVDLDLGRGVVKHLDEQPAERICTQMGLSETQFRLIKSRVPGGIRRTGQNVLRTQAGEPDGGTSALLTSRAANLWPDDLVARARCDKLLQPFAFARRQVLRVALREYDEQH